MCSPDIPDTSAAQREAIEAQERLANRQFDLQREALDYFRQRTDRDDAVTQEVVRRQMELAEEAADQGRDIFEYQKEVFRPVEQSLVDQAMRESTPEYYERYAQEAMARQAAANRNAQAQMERTMASMGVNPNSGAYMAQQRGLQLANAANMGAVANQARDQAEALSWARRADVAGLGKGLVGAGNASYGLATGANTSAGNLTNQSTQTAGQVLGTGMQYGQLGMQGMGNVVNAYNDIYRTQTQAAAQGGMDGLWGALGTGLGLWASKGFPV